MAKRHTPQTPGIALMASRRPQHPIPPTDWVLVDPIARTLADLERHAQACLELDPSNSQGRVVQGVVDRIRDAIWEGHTSPDERTPADVARLLSLSEDTIRNWCKAGKVASRRTHSGRFMVDLNSALAFAGQPGKAA